MKHAKYILSLALLLGAASCEQILEQTPTNQVTDAQLWQDEYMLESHLAELYAMSVFMVGDAVALYGQSPLNIDFNINGAWNVHLGVSAQGEGPIHMVTVGDEAKYSERGAQTNYIDVKLNGIQTDTYTMRWWSNGYYLNRQLNHFIESIEASPLSTATKRKAEARFLRAFNYFAMVKRYGGVPLILKETPLNAPESDIYPARNSEKDCYDFIIKECLEIADILDPNPDVARASRWSALALASRAALYAGTIAKYGKVQYEGLLGFDASDADAYFDQAIKACERIMKESGHGLYKASLGKKTFKDYVKNLEDVFLVKSNTEILMAKHHRGTMGDTPETADLWSWDICMAPKPNAWSVGQYAEPYYDFIEHFGFRDGRSGVIPHEALTAKTWTMEELLGDRDPRLSAWVWTNGYHWQNAVGSPWGADTVSMYRGIRLDGSDDPAKTYYDIAPAKEVYKDGDLKLTCYGDQIKEIAASALYHTGFGVAKNLEPGSEVMNWFLCSTTDYVIFRYAEILLNYAEACFERNRTGDAKDAINEIRSRAGVNELDAVTLEDIREERLRELCFENHRYWDLRRWRTAEEVLSKPHWGISYILDWESYKASVDADGKRNAQPRFWIEFQDHIDSGSQDPTFPEKNYYFPLGHQTTAVNPQLRENPGY